MTRCSPPTTRKAMRSSRRPSTPSLPRQRVWRMWSRPSASRSRSKAPTASTIRRPSSPSDPVGEGGAPVGYRRFFRARQEHLRRRSYQSRVMRSGGIAVATGLSLLVAFASIAAGDTPGAAAGTAPSDASAPRDAFLQPLSDLPFEKNLDFAVGQALFERLWVAAPASTKSADGLGPLFNARSCESCHVRNGRGAVPTAEGRALGLVLRLSVTADDGAALPEPTYGEQLQDLAIAGQKAEGRLHVEYTSLPVRLADGEIVELQQPHYSIVDPAFGPLAPNAMLSPRLAPPVIGLGLVAMIPAAQILAGADPDDRDGDGVAGRPNFISAGPGGATALGRFGWKAGHSTLDQQIAQALSLDIGISSALA